MIITRVHTHYKLFIIYLQDREEIENKGENPIIPL